MNLKILSILLLLLFVAPVATTFVVLKYQRKQIRKEVKRKIIAGIDKEELVLLKFTEKEKKTVLHWKHAKEFQFRGEMYDIVKTQVLGDTTYYWCWWDHEETKLSRQLNDILGLALAKHPKNKETQNKLQHFFKSLYTPTALQKNMFFCLATAERDSFAVRKISDKYFFGRVFYQSLSNPPPVPPPEIG